MKNQKSKNNLNIKFAIVDYFSNKNISSREKNGQKKRWDLDTVLNFFYGKQFVLKVRVYKELISINEENRKVIFKFEDGLHHTMKCTKQEFESWVKNLKIEDIKLLRETITDDKNKVTLKHKMNLELKNKVGISL